MAAKSIDQWLTSVTMQEHPWSGPENRVFQRNGATFAPKAQSDYPGKPKIRPEYLPSLTNGLGKGCLSFGFALPENGAICLTALEPFVCFGFGSFALWRALDCRNHKKSPSAYRLG